MQSKKGEKMITVDCNKAMAIRDALLEFVADKLAVMPILKSEKFILTTLEESQVIEKSQVLDAIAEFLKSNELEENFQVLPKGDEIKITTQKGKDIKEKLAKLGKNKKDLFFECTHCGFMTQYEIEWRNHKLIHYI
jgi:hypothetical protein